MNIANNIYEERKKAIGQRIQLERKKLKKDNGKSFTQEDLANEINRFYNNCETVTQGAISQWEKGERVPPIERLLVLSNIFHCDCAYLLCDYDEKTHGVSEIRAATGLSEDSINHLCSDCKWGLKENAHMIDLLLLDARERKKEHHFRPILNLLSFFFKYKNMVNSRKQVFSNGYIVDYPDTDGFISSNAINLNNRIIENAVLMEIQQALTSLKETMKEE